MDGLPPPSAPTVQLLQQSWAVRLSPQEVEAAVQALKLQIGPRMIIKSYEASEYPGHIKVVLQSSESPDSQEQIAYTDRTGRYLILAIILDTKRGKILDGALEGRSQ